MNGHRASLPSVDRLLRRPEAAQLVKDSGRLAVTDAIRGVLAELRARVPGEGASVPSDLVLIDRVAQRLEEAAAPSLRPVFNLTGTVIHTSLGRAQLASSAIDAMVAAARQPTNLEFDLDDGQRGDRDDHLETQLRTATGAEAATVVNNNAAAVLLVLNTLALRKEVPTSRGELIEIGGSFRMPEIMARAGCRLREVGTTNRTHLRDFEEAIGPKTGLVIKVHTSNYAIEGFTAAVPERALAELCRRRGVPFVVDLGSGSLLDLRPYGLPREPTPAEALSDGADVVTFSGDKLLGGPQAGIIVGRADVMARIKRNPLKRALRVDKLTIAALSSTLALYADPARLAERLPVLRLLTRPAADIRAAAERVQPAVAERLAAAASVAVIDTDSQIGSGALPTRRIPSAGLAIRPATARRNSGIAVARLAAAFRALAIPVIGRIHDGALVLDLRCLDDEEAFVAQLSQLAI